MTTHQYRAERFHNTLGSHEPVLGIRDGDTLITSTVDAWGYDGSGQQVARRGNPQTGPFYVEGAQPGDMLEVHLERIVPNRAHGFSKPSLAPNVVDPEFVSRLPVTTRDERVEWNIALEENSASLATPSPRLAGLKLPLAPMLGCFGVAPPNDQAISTATSGVYGGNMDYRGFRAGTTAYFPVFAPGALLFLGDGHALQGDGEIGGTGVEISMDVQVRVRLHEGKSIGWPRGRDERGIFTVGNARPLDQAAQHATTEMLRWLEEDYELDRTSANIVMSQGVEYEIGNFFDPAYTIVCRIGSALLG